MYTTTFSNNSVLRVDTSKFELTCKWLTKHGVEFEVNRFFGSDKAYARFDFISAPQSVIDAHNAKFNSTSVVNECSSTLYAEIEFILYGLELPVIQVVADYFEVANDNSIIDNIISIVKADNSFNTPSEVLKELKFILE